MSRLFYLESYNFDVMVLCEDITQITRAFQPNDRLIGEMEAEEYLKRPIDGYDYESEREFEGFAASKLKPIFLKLNLAPADRIERQLLIVSDVKIIPDIIVRHEDGSISIIEIKCALEKSKSQSASLQCHAIGQLLLYKSVFLTRKADQNIRLFLITNKLEYRTLTAVIYSDIPISLIEINRTEIFIPYLLL